MLYVLFIIAIIYITLKLVKRDVDDFSTVTTIQKKIHKYSGVQPDLYTHYLANINLAKQHITDTNKSKMFFYKSLHYLEELALYGESGDLDILEDLTYLIQELGYTFEGLLLNSAINNGVRFRPKYLNEKIDA